MRKVYCSWPLCRLVRLDKGGEFVGMGFSGFRRPAQCRLIQQERLACRQVRGNRPMMVPLSVSFCTY